MKQKHTVILLVILAVSFKTLRNILMNMTDRVLKTIIRILLFLDPVWISRRVSWRLREEISEVITEDILNDNPKKSYEINVGISEKNTAWCFKDSV